MEVKSYPRPVGRVPRTVFLDLRLADPESIGESLIRTMRSHSSMAKKLSAIALSKQSSADPVKGSTPISLHRLPKASEVYCDPLSE